MKLQMPDRKFLGGFIVGILWGLVIAFICGTLYLRHALIVEMECKGDVDSTIAKIQENAAKLPVWKTQQVACAVPVTPDGSKIASLRLCHAGYANEMLEPPDSRKFAAVIPCMVAVYGKPDGKTYLSRLNMPLLARIVGGEPAYVFPKKIVPEQVSIMSGVMAK